VEGERGKRRLWPWLVVIAVLGGLAAYNYWPTGPDKIIVSRETTYILGPLNADGTPNYVAYLDAKCAQGVTAENNAAPLLLRAFGPDLLPAKICAETLSRLNLPADILDRDKHFIGWKARARPAKADANAAGGANAASSSAPAEKDEDESESEPNFNDVFNMLLAGQVHPDLEAWLASNSGPLELVRQATARDQLYFPLVSASTPPNLAGVGFPSWSGYTHVPRALAMRAILKAARNDMQGAWGDVLTAHRVARLQDRSPSLIGRLVGHVADSIAAQVGIAFATRYPMPPAEAREILSKLVAIEPRGNVVDAFDEGDRFIGLDIVMMLSRWVAGKDVGLPSLPSTGGRDLDWNQMLREMTTWYDAMVKPLRLPRFHGREEAQKAFDEKRKEFQADIDGRYRNTFRMFLLSHGGRLSQGALTEAVTNLMVAMSIWSLSQRAEGEDEVKMTFEIETLAVALACFHAEHGRWPAELKELCPSLLKAIPPDRFSEKPLVYRPSEKGYLLYSVGRNLRDDGGQRERIVGGKVVNEGADDIVAEVKPIEAASKPAEAASRPAASQPTEAASQR
jgi:hypothetical protein